MEICLNIEETQEREDDVCGTFIITTKTISIVGFGFRLYGLRVVNGYIWM
jgi:hypothetical protein